MKLTLDSKTKKKAPTKNVRAKIIISSEKLFNNFDHCRVALPQTVFGAICKSYQIEIF